MKKAERYISSTLKTVLATIILAFYQSMAWAQDVVDVEVHPENAKSWLANNWMWVALGALVLIIILIAASGGGSSRHKKTTIVREDNTGGVTRTTTTEIIE